MDWLVDIQKTSVAMKVKKYMIPTDLQIHEFRYLPHEKIQSVYYGLQSNKQLLKKTLYLGAILMFRYFLKKFYNQSIMVLTFSSVKQGFQKHLLVWILGNFQRDYYKRIKSSILTNRECYTNLIRATRGSAIDAILVFSLTSPLLKVNNEKKC